MIKSGEFFFIFIDASNNLNFYKLKFGNQATDWINKLIWISSWVTKLSEAMLSLDGELIYSFSAYGQPQYLYFLSFKVSSGGLQSSRYKSSDSWTSVLGSSQTKEYLIANIVWSSNYFLFYNKNTSEFMVRKFDYSSYGIGVEPITER